MAYKTGRIPQVVQTPEFIPPSEEQLSDLFSYLDVRTKNSLAVHGISIDEVQKAYKQLLADERSWMKISESAGGQSFKDMTERLSASMSASAHEKNVLPIVKEDAEMPEVDPGSVVIITDPFDNEALSAANLFIKDMSNEIQEFKSEKMHILSGYSMRDFEKVHTCIARSRSVIIFCSSGTLWSQSQLLAIMEADIQSQTGKEDTRPAVIAVQLSGFKQPSTNYFQDVLPKILPRATKDATQALQRFFVRDFLYLDHSDTKEVLKHNAEQIAKRIPRKCESGEKRQRSPNLLSGHD